MGGGCKITMVVGWLVIIGCDWLCRGSLWLGVVVAGCAVVVGLFNFG